MMRNIGIWLVIGLAMMVLFNLLGPRSSGSRELPFSDFISKVESGSVLEVVMRGRQVEGLTDANERFQTQVPNYPALFEILEKILINGPPIKKTIINDEISERPVLNVRYLNTFKKE